jgi:hypothetical protein
VTPADDVRAGTSAAAAAGAAAAVGTSGAAASDLQKLRSFRLSFDDIVQEEALEEDLDDTLKLTRSGSLDGSKCSFESGVVCNSWKLTIQWPVMNAISNTIK